MSIKKYIENYLEFGPLLRLYRLEKKIKNKELAKKTNLSSGHISFLEMGKRRPKKETIEKIADNLELNNDERQKIFEAAGFYYKELKKENLPLHLIFSKSREREREIRILTEVLKANAYDSNIKDNKRVREILNVFELLCLGLNYNKSKNEI